MINFNTKKIMKYFINLIFIYFILYIFNTIIVSGIITEILYTWGLGIGDWGLGIGPIPNPHSKYMKLIFMIMNHLYNLIKMIKNFYILNNKSKKS